MKKLFLMGLIQFVYILIFSNPAQAAEKLGIGKDLSPWWMTFFVVMLLCIAILPLVAEKWWHPNKNKTIVSVILGLPILIVFFIKDFHAVLHTGQEYISFIVLLGALFVISGGIFVQTEMRATPMANTGFLALGSVLASFMGTTGAAMLLIRPLIATNKYRTKKVHTIIFFTFLVANIGGSLTPLGDPPLFMGYLKGVPFEWTFNLVSEWAAVVGFLLLVYFVLDTFIYTREPTMALEVDKLVIRPTHVGGAGINIPLLVGVVLSVAFINEHYLPKEWPFPLTPFPIRELVLIGLSVASWVLTSQGLRRANEFTFYPIIEVAVLFAGIFATMVPAILILNARGAELGVQTPIDFFWATGILSAFLDNTPTYVVFFSLAQGLGVPVNGVEVASTGVDKFILIGISLGAVFMGAMTYIGNAPNFMVKSIAADRGIKMPSFFGYMLWSVVILIPVFFGVTLIFL